MRALVCRSLGWPQDLDVEPWPRPAPAVGRVLVRVAAAGLNFADSLMLGGPYQERLAPPFVPGVEFAGTVAEASPQTGWRAGDRVMGQVDGGAYAEYLLADPQRLVAVPAGMPDDVAGGFFIPYGTAYCGLVERGQLRAGQRVLVLGAAGATGLAAVAVARALDAHVIGTTGSYDKHTIVRDAGADVAIDHAQEDLRGVVMAATDGAGVDLVFDTVGGAASLAALRCLAFEGTLLVVGFTAGAPASFPANHVLVKNVNVAGFYWGAYQARDPGMTRRAFEVLGRWYDVGLLRPRVAARVPLEEASQALRRLLAREYTGKVVVTIGQAQEQRQ